MYANDMLDYGDKIIEAFRNGNFSSEHLKKNRLCCLWWYIGRCKWFYSENWIDGRKNEVCSRIFLNHQKSKWKQRNCSWNRRPIIRFKRQKKKMSETVKKYKNADKTLKIIEEILDYNKNSQNFFLRASKVDKGKSVCKKQ